MAGEQDLGQERAAGIKKSASEPEPEPEPDSGPKPEHLSAHAAELASLRAQLVATQEKLQAAEDTLGHWRAAARDFTHASCFGPLACQYYKETLTTLLTKSLLQVEGVEAVRWVSCSFPSVPAHAPQMELAAWQGLGADSLWDVRWEPPWCATLISTPSLHAIRNPTIPLCTAGPWKSASMGRTAGFLARQCFA